MKLKEAMARETYVQETSTLNMANMRPTDMRTNRRVIIPKPRPPIEEAELLVRRYMWGKILVQYMKEHCHNDGRQLASNMSPSARRGLVKLSARNKKGEIIVYESDKCGKLCITTPDSYRRQGVKHTSNDVAIDWNEARLHQHMLNGMARAIANSFSMGQAGRTRLG